MDRYYDADAERDPYEASPDSDGEHHATTGGAAAAGAVTGGVIGLTGGPLGAALGAVGGALIGVAAERMMHADDESVPMDSPLDAPVVVEHAPIERREDAKADLRD